MAFVEKRGSRYLVKQGNTGECLSSFGSKKKADNEVNRLHRKNKPKQVNRGASAKKKFGKNGTRKKKSRRRR